MKTSALQQGKGNVRTLDFFKSRRQKKSIFEEFKSFKHEICPLCGVDCIRYRGDLNLYENVFEVKNNRNTFGKWHKELHECEVNREKI